ncbi:MAG: VWA-like domain-containing protein [Eubacteriales bacterium]|nr:VWA-like domain-containing protein [Eubacteriales bacterium]
MAELPVKDGEQLTRAEMREQDSREDAMDTARRIALQILTLTRNGLFVQLRFMDVALCQFVYVSADQTDLPFEIKKVATTGEHLIFDPRYIIQQYMREKKSLSRDYLHMVLHCIFRHPFVSTNMNREYWDLAADIAAEATICDLELNQTEVQNATEISYEIERIRGFVTQMNAEHIYRFLLTGDISARDINRWEKLFCRDEHDIWWEAARRIEEENKKKAEEEAEQDEGEEPEQQDDENLENSEEDQEKNPDAEDSDENPDESDEESDEGDEKDGTGESEDEDQENGDDSESDESDAADDESDDEGDQDDSQDNNGDEDSEEPPYDEFEDEYVSSPGGDNENSDEPSQGDPDSDTRESEDESSGEGEGGGNPGEEPEQTDEEGADRDNDTSTDGLEGSDDGHKPDKDNKNDKAGELGGQTDEGVPDDSENPFGDQSQEGNADPGDGSGGIQKNEGSKSGEHSAGSGGGGEGKQAAWQHEGGSERRSDGERDMNDMRKLDGSADMNSEQQNISGDDQKQEAKPEQGTADSGEEPPADKQPSFMHNGDEQEELENKWKEISERMLVDLETSSKEWGDKSDAMVQNLRKINRDKYDYQTFLQKFSTMREDIQINDDEFDYIYYTYGLEHYHDMPLIEPLEYKEVKKVRDFVIAIDTSGSCAGEVVQKFLDKTYSIFSQQENFFRKINLHIIQCDAAIQSDVKITNKQEFADYMKDLEFRGFGGTDFRPVFEYVNQLIEHNEFDDLKGLIYFTDGNGIYPKKRPPYETAFVFVDDDEFDYEVPSWAMKLVLETSDITEEVLI